MLPRWRMADSRQKILSVEGKGESHVVTRKAFRSVIISEVIVVFHSLLASGWQEPHHLHGQLKPLKVMLQVFSFHREAVLPGDSDAQSVSGENKKEPTNPAVVKPPDRPTVQWTSAGAAKYYYISLFFF